jgi:hypothetical protein
MGIEQSFGHLLGGHLDGFGDLPIKQIQLCVGDCGVFFDETKSANEGTLEPERANGEILDSASGLGTVIGVRRHLHIAHGIGFGSKFCVHGRFYPTPDEANFIYKNLWFITALRGGIAFLEMTPQDFRGRIPRGSVRKRIFARNTVQHAATHCNTVQRFGVFDAGVARGVKAAVTIRVFHFRQA